MMRLTSILITSIITIRTLSIVNAAVTATPAPLEPVNGNVLLGAWVDSVPQVGDTPTKFNERINNSVGEL